jgi:glucokinase-like ROK family protein
MARQPRPRTGDQSLVREINLSLIINELREQAPISRAHLAEITGLNKTTVSSLVQELMTKQFVREVGYDNRGVGRPAMLLELNPQAGCIVGGEIGVDFINVIRTDFSSEMVWHRKEQVKRPASQREMLDRTFAMLHEAVDSRDETCGRLFGVAVGVPGVVDQGTGSLIFAPNLGWRDVPLGALLREEFPGVPIFVDNEANLAALGEHYSGVAQGYSDVLFISVDVGLGGGIVRGGQLFRGKMGFAGEFGHITIDPGGLPCRCGNRGCWETLVSSAALFRYIGEAVDAGKQTLLTGRTGCDLSQLAIPLVIEAAEQGDAVALDAFRRVGCYLGVGIASLINALNPELVVFGGSLSLAADYLMPAVEEELAGRAISWKTDPTDVVLARHGDDACVMGGVATVLQTVFAQPSAAVAG